jgi:hypothetical protein
MTSLRTTQHAVQRLAQRGFSASDVDLIMTIGSEVRDGFLVRRKDCEALEAGIKALISRIRKLEGKRVVIAEGRLVTAYHASAAEEPGCFRGDARAAHLADDAAIHVLPEGPDRDVFWLLYRHRTSAELPDDAWLVVRLKWLQNQTRSAPWLDRAKPCRRSPESSPFVISTPTMCAELQG